MAKIWSIIATLPFGVLVVTLIAYFRISIDNSLSAIIFNFSYALYAVALLLSWWFNRSRVFFITIVIALSQYALSELAAANVGMPGVPADIYPVICILLPINIFVFSLLKERGIFNAWGLGRFCIIGFQAFYISLATISNDASLLSLFSTEILTDTFAGTAIPQSAIFAYIMAFLLIVRRQLKNRSHLDNALLAVLVASMIALHLKNQPLAIPIFFCAAEIMLIIAVVQDSYSMAYLDELTGLPARRALKEELMKLRGEYTIAMVDIDFFKKFNDTYGHDTGDEVLRLVASVLKKVTGGGKAFRYGGEEFTIVFPHTKIADALPYLEELRIAVEKTPYAYRGSKEKKTKKKPSLKQLFVTISVGVAERSDKNKQTQEVIKAADKALYRAKKKGRNCVSK
ncbi:GGDEF domain-containing protein [Sporomusa malonica]|uniref:Diguanylate cyclase (GGDEF) domain-containing protein n=1 Tax=Sporomusa malonica TaxID=112901 RepID=A0A1W2DZ18_9FIRM|nr:GGDEF domain-containing protein [Sporomusa malonica]SMD02805.1 diguanylate cyclase (GGDEF) domain-containing protein [Sporomusa malonica]